nr:transposase [Sediminibacillus halophilus]
MKTPIHMKRSEKLLWKSPSKLLEEEPQKVEKLLQNHPRLKEAYVLKNIEAFRRVRKTFMGWKHNDKSFKTRFLWNE